MTENEMPDHDARLQDTRQIWNEAAASFDEQPDHGLHDPHVRAAWKNLLQDLLPSTPGIALDIGCGTGSLTVLLAELGHTVTGADISPSMIELARQKTQAAHHKVDLRVMDAAFPIFQPQQFDVIVCRHLLWALPDPDQVLRRWANLLKRGGRLILIEGYWHTDAGLHAQDVINMLPAAFEHVAVHTLSNQPELWGGKVTDERYAILAHYPI
jgi:2-polyprenyl-3-methyl-5-hydroxy-6-metoxy-1,4-benzoquinol methylase